MKTFYTVLSKHYKYFLFFVAALGLLLRMYPTNWDAGYYTHPDEMHIYSVTSQLSWDDLNPDFFAYGSLPFYILRIVAHALSPLIPALETYGKLFILGRPLNALFDTGTLLVIFILAKQLTRRSTYALFASLLYSILVFPIQNAHFYTVDTQLTFWLMLSLTTIVRWYRTGAKRYFALSAIAFSAAFATKFSAIILLPIIGITIVSHAFRDEKPLPEHLSVLIRTSFTFLLFFVSAQMVFQPYLFLDFETYRKDILFQLNMRKDAYVFPYTLQYIDTKAYLYPFAQIHHWGTGPAIAIAGALGLCISITKLSYTSYKKKSYVPELSIALFGLLFFAILGSSAVKFMRYYLPLYPIICLGVVVTIRYFVQSTTQSTGLLLSGLILILSGLWTTGFYSLYFSPHPWVVTSDWIFENITPGTTIAVEHWDRSLPLYDAHMFQTLPLNLYEPDTPAKIDQIVTTLNHVDYIIISSNRLHGSIPKWPEKYPATIYYYDLLFKENLGFTKVHEATRYPHIGPWHLNDQSADESFTVYDHPRTNVFKKTTFTPETVREILLEKVPAP